MGEESRMRPSSRRFVARFAALVAIANGSCLAQFSRSIQGTIHDPASAVVPNAAVQLKNTQTGVLTKTTSDNEGNYRFVSLAPGSYQLTVDASGFSSANLAFGLETSQNLDVPVTMQLAGASQTVEVTGQSPL